MAKEINTQSVTFNPTAKTIDFSAWDSFDVRKLVAIVNDTRNTLIYSIANNGNGLASEVGSVITLQFDTTGHNASDKLTIIYDDTQEVISRNSNPIFNDTFNSFDTTNIWNIITQASGDIIAVDGNTIGANYLVLSIDPLGDNTETIIESKQTFNATDKVITINPSVSQRFFGHEFSTAFVSTETPTSPAAPVAISSISQTTTTLSVTTSVNHNLQVGDRISISDVPDSRLNYTNLVVTTVPNYTTFTSTGYAAGTLPSVTSSVFNTGQIFYRPTLDYIPNGVASIFENSSASNFSAFVKNGGNNAYPSGTIGGNHSLTISSLISSQQVIGQYDNINFQAPITQQIIIQEDQIIFQDKGVDNAGTIFSVRQKRESVISDPIKDYKIRFKIKANKSSTRPIAKIVSAVKTGTTTATITTDVAHGLTINDFINIFGIRDIANFPNLNTATAVASIVSSTQFTVVIGSASTNTSYGGYVSRANGGFLQIGATTMSAQSIARTSNVLTLIGSSAWSGIVIGDYVNLHGCRDNINGANLGLDGSYKVIYFTGTTLNLIPIGSAPTGADIATTNCGGGIIKRSDFRIHKISVRKLFKNLVQIYGASGTADASNSLSVNLQNNAVAGTVAHSSAASGNPVRIGGKVISTLDTTLVNNDVCDFPITSAGQSIQKPYGSSENDWQYTGILSTTTAAAMTTAGAASIRNYLTALTYQNTSATATTIIILDGSTAIHTLQASATMAMPAIISFLTPLRGTAATALNINCGTTGASVLVNAQGYKSF